MLKRAAIILLGKMFSENLLTPAVIQVTWTLRDKNKDVVDYEHFSVPYTRGVLSDCLGRAKCWKWHFSEYPFL